MAATNEQRRRFLKLAGLGLIAWAPASLLANRAFAAEKVKLTEDDGTAKALKYVHKAPTEAANCANCMHIQGAEGEQWRPCGLFPNKLVNNDGWCAAWVAKPD